MLSRRTFVLGLCCAAHTRAARADEASKLPVYICSTIDMDGNGGFSIENYSKNVGKELEIDTTTKNFGITPYGTAFYKDRWLQSDGLTPSTGLITLGVCFQNGSGAQRSAVIGAASQWVNGDLSKKLDFKFDVPASESQIRVEFDAPANDSYVGRQNLNISTNRSTLRLHDVVPSVIQHEFGHALGLQHEQQFPDQTIQWNEGAVIAEMSGPPNYWSAATTKANILNKYKSKDAVCIGDRAFNEKSIMLYPIPSRWTVNGFSVGTNPSISNGDLRCLRGLYGA